MAGKETRGVEHSDPHLFAHRTWFLVSTASAPSSLVLDAGPGAQFVAWIRRIGAIPVPISADRHDELVSFTSHLPQLISTALANLLAGRLGVEQAGMAAGPGLHDMTRLARSSYEIWADILGTNADRVGSALDAFMDQLAALRRRLPPEASTANAEFESQFEIGTNFAKALQKANT
jgi:prephenate dehydrogenase